MITGTNNSLTALNGGITLNAGTDTLYVSGLNGKNLATVNANNGNVNLTGSVVTIGGGGTGSNAQIIASSGNIALTATGGNNSSIAGPLTANNVGGITITNAGTGTMFITKNVTTDQGSITLTTPSTSSGEFDTNAAFTTGTGNKTINLNGTGSSLTASGGSFTSDYAPGSSPAKLSGGFTINLAGDNTVLSASNTSFTSNYGNLAVNVTGNMSINSSAIYLDNKASLDAETGSVMITYSGTTTTTGSSMVFGNTGYANVTANGGSISIFRHRGRQFNLCCKRIQLHHSRRQYQYFCPW